jgi:Mg-chelatase subunit ChlD
MQNTEPPQEYICPITQGLLEDPYTDRQGISYSKESIIEWLKNNNISPSTRSPLTVQDLTPNLALKSLVEQWKKNHSDYDKVFVQEDSLTNRDVSNNIENIVVFDKDTNSTSIQLRAPDLPSDEDRLPVTFIVCVDTSGSMGGPAVIKGEEDSGLSILDLVKHAIKTLINNMNKDDKITLITYNSSANIECESVKMDICGKSIVDSILDKLVPSGTTNIWDGLFKSMETINVNTLNPYIMLFTDGQPTVSPPRGERYYLSKYIDEKGVKAPLYTYGFGNSLDTELLNDISLSGNGRFGFIPDIGFVGTIFVHSQANILANMANNVTIQIEGEIQKQDILGNYKTTITSWGAEIEIGSVQFSQEKTIVINKIIESKNINVKYRDLRNNNQYTASNIIKNDKKNIQNHLDNYARLFTINKIYECISIKENNNSESEISFILKEISDYLNLEKYKDRQKIKDLITDVENEITKALSNEYYNKWGKKYLFSILNAHLNQECNNFKDPGIQGYCTTLFSKIRDKADDIFINLPPPKPSRNTYNYGRNQNCVSAPVNMSTFHNSSGPCFAPWCRVELSDGKFKRVDSIKRGDKIKSIDPNGNNTESEVICVIETEIENSRCKMSILEPSNLVITPWHPVRIEGKWKFPENINLSEERDCEKIYSFVLNRNHIIYINDVQCITLGHGIQNNNVVSHEYFGTRKVVLDLQKSSGWVNGIVKLNKNSLIRSSATGRVVGMNID